MLITLEEKEARSMVARETRAKANLRHIKANGPKRSAVRLAQFEDEVRRVTELRSRGITNTMQPGMPRRSVDVTDDDHREWWLAQPEGLDMVYAATSFDCKLWMRKGDSTQRQALYDLHLRQYTEAKVEEIVNSKPVLLAIEQMAKEEMSRYYKLPKKTHQILFCMHCAASDICGPSDSGVAETMEQQGISTGRERWASRDESMDLRTKNPRTLKRMKSTRVPSLGVVNFKLIYAHEMYEHHHLVDLSGVTNETLSEQGLVWMDPTPYLARLAATAKYGDMIPTDVMAVPKILVHRQSSDYFIETVVVYRLIQTRVSLIPPFDSQVAHAAQVAPKLLEAILAIIPKCKQPVGLADCPSHACKYLSLRGTVQGQHQHTCFDGKRKASRISPTTVAHCFAELDYK